MPKYIIWDKQSDIYTLGRDALTGKMRWTADEYIEANAPWAANPNAKVIVASGLINGMAFLEFEATKDHYRRQGAEITDDMTDREVLDAIERFEDFPPQGEPTPEERMAAALEFQSMMLL